MVRRSRSDSDEGGPVVKFEFAFAEKDIKIGEQVFKFRELSVAENDFCAEAARNEKGDIDPRKMMRLMIAKSAVEPTLSLEELLAIPNRAYLRFAEIVNDLNSPDEDEDEAKND